MGEQLTPTSIVSNLTVIKIKFIIIAMLYVEMFWLLLQDVNVSALASDCITAGFDLHVG